MSENTKKIIFPAFGLDGWNTIHTLHTPESLQHTFSKPDQKILDFYRASSTLLRRFLQNGFSSNFDGNNIGIESHLSPSNEFSMYFFLPPKSILNGQGFLEIIKPFICELVNANSDGDLSSIQIISTGTPDSPVYILRSSNIRDMLLLSERVLAPYDMTLPLSFKNAQGLSLANSFRLDTIYDLPRIRSLASLALGKTREVNGLHLNH